jgi:RimJ/RimL family protein N-acetyltransferase
MMISTEIPELETPRLRLRAFREADFEPLAGFFASDLSHHFGGPCSRADAWRKFAVYVGHWSLRGYGPWALEEKTSGQFVGLSGPWFPEGWPEPEISWALMPGHHGKGYATEAARRALRAAYQHFGWKTAVSVIAADNAPSHAVALRLGAVAERKIDFFGGKADVYRHVALPELGE